MNPVKGQFDSGFRSDHLKSRPLVEEQAASHWYALHTRSRFEKVVDRLLREKSFETFLPLVVKRSSLNFWRSREAELPLFPGYTFVRLAPSHETLRTVRATTGVAAIVGSAAGPVFIPDVEIESVATLMAHHVTCTLTPCFRSGQRVLITHGPLKGVQGEIVRRKNQRVLVVKIRLIQRCLEVGVSPHDLEAAEPAGNSLRFAEA